MSDVIEKIDDILPPDAHEQLIGHDHSKCGSECGEFHAEIHVDHVDGRCDCADCTNSEAMQHVDMHVHTAECAKLPGHGAAAEVDRGRHDHDTAKESTKKESLSSPIIDVIPERIRQEIVSQASLVEAISKPKQITEAPKRNVATETKRVYRDTLIRDNKVEVESGVRAEPEAFEETVAITPVEAVEARQVEIETIPESLIAEPIETVEAVATIRDEIVLEERVENVLSIEVVDEVKTKEPIIDIAENVYSLAEEVEDTIGRLVLPQIEPTINLSSSETDHVLEVSGEEETTSLKEDLILNVSTVIVEQYSLLIEDPELEGAESLRTIISLLKTNLNATKETTKITPELHADIVRLMDLLGFEDAEKSLQAYINKYGINFLGDLLAKFFEVLNQKVHNRESLLQDNSTTYTKKIVPTLGMGRVVLSILGFNKISLISSNGQI